MTFRFLLPIAFVATLAYTPMASTAGLTGADSQFVSFVNIDSTDPAQPNIINRVKITCPADGFLVSTASAQITLNTGGLAGEPSLQYGITKNSTSQDINHHHLVSQYTASGTAWASVSYQRTDNCRANQRVNIRFVAHKLDASSADAQKSNLTVVFYERPKL